MKAAQFIVVMIAATISVAAQPVKGKVVNVQIVSDSLADHQASCTNNKGLSPTTVLISGNDVYHCVDGKLLNHADEKKTPDVFKKTLVQLNVGDSINWSANVDFRVVQIRKHQPVTPAAPAYPFTDDLPTAFTKSVTVGGVVNLEGSVVQQYKVTFEIGKPGNRVDPDVVCSM